MASLTVLVAPSGVADGVRAVLTDLSAAGLVDPFLWLTDPSAAALPEVLTMVERGRTIDTTLQQLVMAQAVEKMRFCALVPLLGDDRPLSVAQETAVADLFAETFGGAQTVRVRALLARPGLSPPFGTEIAVGGWHNLLIAPEDGRGPGVGLGRVPLPASVSAADIGRHAAPVVAGALGMWSGLDHAPMDDQLMRPGNVVRLVRSYYRRVETGQAEFDLRRQLLLDDGRLPLPSTQQGQVVYAQNEAKTASAMAERFWRKNVGEFVGSRTEYPKPKAKEEMKALQALKLFFGFMWAALKNAPAAWLKSVVDKFSEGVASGINRTVFGGGDSAYEVVFNGRTARGRPAGWAEIAGASSQLNNALASGTGGVVQLSGVRADLSKVWQDYSQAALTLADAGPRNEQLPPAQAGINREVIRQSANVVPGPAARFDQISGVVAAAIEIDGVDATDKLGIDFLRYNLKEFERTRPEQGGEARTALTQLDEWQQQHDGSFGVQVGRKLAEMFNGVYSEVRDLLTKLSVPLDPPPEPDDKNKKLARWIQLGFLFILLVAGAVVYFNRVGRLTWWLAMIIAVGVFVITICTIAWNYLQNQRELFQLLYRRQSMIATRVAQEKRLLEALRDLEKLAQSYSEYLSWSRALGTFLAAPLGPNVYGSSSVLNIAWGLPLSTAIGYAAPAEADVAATVGRLRHGLFSIGWLTSLWEDLVLNASPGQFGAAQVELDGSPLWFEAGAGSGSTLDRWSAALFSGTLTSSGAEKAWQRAVQQLAGPASQLQGILVARVRSSDGSVVPTRDFLTQLDDAAAFADRGLFRTSLLDAGAVVNGANKVQAGLLARNQTGVGLTCALTQLSDAIAVHQLKFDQVDGDPQGVNDIELPQLPSFGPSTPQARSHRRDDEIRPPEGVQGLT